jgi:hypothetical protein
MSKACFELAVIDLAIIFMHPSTNAMELVISPLSVIDGSIGEHAPPLSMSL